MKLRRPFSPPVLLLCVCSLLFLPACSVAEETDAAIGTPRVLGETEYLFIQEAGVSYDSRIDTGATTCSIHVEDLTPFERDGESWVKFHLVGEKEDQKIEVEKPVSRVVKIKRHGTESQERYVVLLGVKLGEEIVQTEFSLTDRGDYTYPLLVGRNLLRGVAVVDVSKSYVLKAKGPKVSWEKNR